MVVALTVLSIRPYLRRIVFPWRCRKTIHGAKHRRLARIILQRFGPPAFSPLCHCRICGMTRPHSSSIKRVVGGIRAGQEIGSSNQPNICFCCAGRAFPSTQTRTLVRQLTVCPGTGQPIHPFTPLGHSPAWRPRTRKMACRCIDDEASKACVG